MLPDKFLQVLQHEGVVAIATQGSGGAHLVNTWNTYVQITKDEHLLIPVGGMKNTEKNVAGDPRVLLTAGTREVAGQHGRGAGFLIQGDASFVTAGDDFDLIKKRFSWARAALKISIRNIAQTL